MVSNSEPLMMVLEFLDKGDLQTLLREKGGEMSCDQLVTICENVG